MPNFEEFLKKADKLDKVQKAEADAFDFADSALLDAGANFFEVFISQLISFQWLTYFLRRLPGKTYQLSLPYLDKQFAIRETLGSDLKNDLRYGTYYQYYHDRISYTFNAFEAPFVVLHWLSSHVGKGLGLLLASPFAAVGYTVKKVYYGIQKAFYNRQLQQEFPQFEPVKFAAEWLINTNSKYLVEVYATKFLGQLSPAQVLDGIFSPSNIDTTLEISQLFASENKNYMDYLCEPDYVCSHQSLVEVRWDQYQIARIKHLETERKWALAKTIVSGMLLVPLLYTIKKYKKLVLDNEQKKAELQIIADEFKEKKDPRLLAGQRFLGSGNNEHGIHVLSAVPQHSVAYQQAMSEIGYNHLAYGAANDAAFCFAESKDERAQQIAETIVAIPNATLADVMTEEDRTAAANLRSLRNNGIFANQSADRVVPYVVAEVRGLDEEDNLNSPLLR